MPGFAGMTVRVLTEFFNEFAGQDTSRLEPGTAQLKIDVSRGYFSYLIRIKL